jgi:YbbR domain-containing protein
MQNFFRKNLRLKLVSLILAISLEAYFISPHNSVTATFTAPVEITNLPDSMIIVSPPGLERGLFAEYKVRGPAPLVQEVQNNPQHVVARLSDTDGAVKTLEMDPKQLRVPSGVEVLGITPAQLAVRLERVVKKELKVVVPDTVSSSESFDVTALKVFPETVLARGPESELRGLNTVETEPVGDARLVRGDQIVDLSLKSVGAKTTLNVNFASVTVRVLPKQLERTFDDVRVRVTVAPGFGATAAAAHVKVSVKGPQSVVEKLDAPEAVVDASQNGAGDHDLEFSVALPEGVRITSVEPASIRVHVVGNHEKTVRN